MVFLLASSFLIFVQFYLKFDSRWLLAVSFSSLIGVTGLVASATFLSVFKALILEPIISPGFQYNYFALSFSYSNDSLWAPGFLFSFNAFLKLYLALF